MKSIPTEFLTPLEKQNPTPPRIITFDIETILKGDKMVPFLISMHDGEESFSWFSNNPDKTDFLYTFAKFITKSKSS